MIKNKSVGKKPSIKQRKKNMKKKTCFYCSLQLLKETFVEKKNSEKNI